LRIAYISTIKNASWGGSEELWYQSAVKAIEDGHELGIFVYDWLEEPLKLSLIRKKGAQIFKRKRSFSRISRIAQKITRSLFSDSLFMNPYKSVIDFKPDSIVITDGATYYTANDKWLTRILHEFKGKYIVIVQGNSAYAFPDSRSEALELFNHAKKTVFVSDENRKQAFHQLARSFNKTTVIQNPVNLSSYDIRELPAFSNDIIHFAMIGRLSVSEKGQDIVFAIMAEAFWKKAPVKFHVYGVGRDLEYLKQLSVYYDVSDKIVFEGHADIEKIWSQCHALIMPSIHEGTPLTLLEAMVVGRICIVTDVGGNAAWIIDQENGYLAAAPTQDLFSEKMKQALENKHQWPAIAARAHSDAIGKLDKRPGERLLDEILATA
jgi:glycosyltransferase involved in cell wall biosynthesis